MGPETRRRLLIRCYAKWVALDCSNTTETYRGGTYKRQCSTAKAGILTSAQVAVNSNDIKFNLVIDPSIWNKGWLKIPALVI